MLCLNIGSELKVKRKQNLAMTEYTCLLPHSSKIKYKMSVSGVAVRKHRDKDLYKGVY